MAVRRSAVVVAVGALGVLAAPAAATTACPSGAGSAGASFATASEFTFTPPGGVTDVCVTAVGAPGGTSEDVGSDSGPFGGEGALVTSWLTVSSPLFVEVGSPGVAGDASSTAATTPGGVPYGGAGGGGAGGGGGETDLRTSSLATPSSASSRILVAGGGGGAGGEDADDNDGMGAGDAGGNGGNAFMTVAGDVASAAAGLTGAGLDASPGGGGGVGGSTSGGTGGVDPDFATDDGGSGLTSGPGGAGGPFATSPNGHTGHWGAGGGGGGGYSGGGGGGSAGGALVGGSTESAAGGGGGGGSSFADPARSVGGDPPAFTDAVTHPPGVTVSWVAPRTLAVAPRGGLAFGMQGANVAGAPLAVTVTNGAGTLRSVGTATTGGEALHVSGITLAGADPGDYAVTSTGCASVAAQATCTIDVTFDAQRTGDRPATLQISSDDRAQTAPVSIPLDGIGLPRTTATSVSCPPGTTTVGAALTCTITVADTATGPAVAPDGSVSLSTDSAGAVASPGTCTLVATGPAGQAHCSLTYTPSATGSGRHTLTAGYTGDGVHAASGGSVVLTVPGAGASGPTTAQIRASLLSQLTPKGTAARIAALARARRYTAALRALIAGTLVVDWYYVPAGAHLAKHSKPKPKPVLVASGRLTYRSANTAKLAMKLTAAGRARLAHAHRLKLTAKATFTPTAKAAIVVEKTFTLER